MRAASADVTSAPAAPPVSAKSPPAAAPPAVTPPAPAPAKKVVPADEPAEPTGRGPTDGGAAPGPPPQRTREGASAVSMTPRALREVPAEQLPPHLAWVRNVYDESRRAVVRIDTEVGTGSGFFFHSRRHVATAFHVIEGAKHVFVSFQDGRRMRAAVVAHDEDHDVALLELPVDAGAQVLEPFGGPLAMGMQVVAIGHPFSDLSRIEPKLTGLLDWSLVTGVVGAFSEHWIQVSGSVNPGNSGGPLLSADGRVIGVISSRLTQAEALAFAARVGELEALVPKIGTQAPPREIFTRDLFEIGWAIQAEEGSLMGVVAGAGVKVDRVFPLRLRLMYVAGTHPPPEESITLEDISRIAGELDAGYTFLQYYVSLTAQVGNTLMHDTRVDQRLPIVFSDPDCASPGCPQRAQVERRERSVWNWMPYVGITAEYGIFRGSYAYQLDVLDKGRSQHRVYAALAF